MALTNDEFKRVVEEFKETGHDHRFRDQLVVQEFSFSMIAVGILLRALNATEGRPVARASGFTVIWANVSCHSHAAPEKH
jgi:hypothetical protein